MKKTESKTEKVKDTKMVALTHDEILNLNSYRKQRDRNREIHDRIEEAKCKTKKAAQYYFDKFNGKYVLMNCLNGYGTYYQVALTKFNFKFSDIQNALANRETSLDFNAKKVYFIYADDIVKGEKPERQDSFITKWTDYAVRFRFANFYNPFMPKDYDFKCLPKFVATAAHPILSNCILTEEKYHEIEDRMEEFRKQRCSFAEYITGMIPSETVSTDEK